MKKEQIKLTDGSGGLNDRDNPATLPVNQFAKLENILTDEGGWPGKKRLGKDLIQYSPIDPQLCLVDANTMGYWDMDQAAFPLTDLSTNNNPLDYVPGPDGSEPTRTAGLLPNGTPYGYQFGAVVPWVDTHVVEADWSAYLDNKNECTIEGWVKFDPDFTGGVIFQRTIGPGNPTDYSNSGSAVVGTAQPGGMAPVKATRVWNGITALRDYDDTTAQDIGGPYFKATIHTKGIPGTVTELFGARQQTGVWLHVRMTYEGTGGVFTLYVNGTQEAQTVVQGAGLIDEPGGTVTKVMVGYSFINSGPSGILAYNQFKGIIDDICISDIVRTGVPFKNPRGKPWPFRKSDGIAQVIVAAGDGLYFTVGDGNWTNIISGQSDSADWDAIQIEDALYLTNGIDAPLVWDGVTVFPWGEPPLPVTVTEIVGNLPATATGHKYVVSFVFGNDEGGPGASVLWNIAVGPRDLELTNIPIGPPGCTARKIYRTKDTLTQEPYYLVREIEDNITTSLTGPYVNLGSPTADTGADGVLDAVLGTGAYLEMTAEVLFTEIPKAKYALSVHNRAWLTGDGNEPYSIFYSELNDPNIFRAQNFIKATEDKGVIRGMAKYYGEIHVSKGGESTLILRGDNPSNWQQLEVLHPTLGAIDHWSFAHRTTPEADSYRLCFMAADGVYEYAGRDYQKVSDNIDGTFKETAQGNSQQRDAIWTDPVDFENVNPYGGGTENAYEPLYSTDGTRQAPGTLGPTDQLNYLGLAKTLVGGIPLGGDIIATENVPGLENNFLFSTDQDNNLYRTTDNFKTAVIETTVTLPHRIVQIVYADVGPGTETYFLFTDENGGGGGGKLYEWEPAPTSLLTDHGNTNGGFYWEQDVPWSSVGVLTKNEFNQTFQTAGYCGPVGPRFDWNPFLTHTQKVTVLYEGGVGPLFGGHFALLYTGAPSKNTDNAFNQSTFLTGASPGPYQFPGAVGPGYFAHNFEGTVASGAFNAGNPLIWPGEFRYYQRQFPRWKGFTNIAGNNRPGVITPQGIWDPITQRLFFSAGHPQDANGHVTSQIYEFDPTSPAFVSKVASKSVLAFTVGQSFYAGVVGHALVYTKQSFSNIPVSRPAYNPKRGFTNQVFGQLLSGGPEVYIGQLPQIDNQASRDTNRLPTSMLFSNINPYRHLIFCGIQYNFGLVSTQFKLMYPYNPYTGFAPNSWYVGQGTGRLDDTGYRACIFMRNNDNLNAGFDWRPTPDFTSNGPVPQNVALSTSPPSYYAYVLMANMNLDTNHEQALWWSPDIASLTPLKALGFDGYETTKGNLLWVPQSGAHGNPGVPEYLWAERLYWNQENPSTSKMVQIGVPGADWEIRGTNEAFAFNSGGFSAFGDFETDVIGTAAFFLRNAALPGIPVATYQPVAINSKILGFPTPAGAFQWKVDWTWDYKTATPTEYPRLEFVRIGLISGEVDVPRVVAEHYKGRTYWAVAERGKTENNKMLVYQKNGSWTVYTGHRIKGMNIFLGDLVALEDYRFIAIEKGRHDAGLLIKSLARTGAIMGNQSDKALRDINMNILSWVNSPTPTVNGQMKIAALSGDKKFPEEWDFPLLSTATPEPRQVIVNSPTPFPYNYARAFSIEVYTSNDTSGALQPVYDQVEDMAGAIITLFMSNERFRIVENE